MNQNDMDRYYWRTGQRWSGDCRGDDRRVTKISGRTWLFLLIAIIVTYALLFHVHL